MFVVDYPRSVKQLERAQNGSESAARPGITRSVRDELLALLS